MPLSRPHVWHLEQPAYTKKLVVANCMLVVHCRQIAAQLVGKVREEIGTPSPQASPPAVPEWAMQTDPALSIGQLKEATIQWMPFKAYETLYHLKIFETSDEVHTPRMHTAFI